MKKITTLLVGAALLMLAGSSWATPYASNDTFDFDHDRYVGRVDSGEAAFVNHQGLNDHGINDLSYTNDTFGSSVAGLKELNSHKRVDATNQSLQDDSQRMDRGRDKERGRDTEHGRTYQGRESDQGKESDHVTDTTPVPEPGTMVLLGLGLLGLAIYGKFRINNLEAC